jgi:mediator of RNA polymerase II transcription subunit 8
VLTQLLRKKLDPEAEEWLAAGAVIAAEKPSGRDDVQGCQRLWGSAGDTARELAKDMPWGANFTLEERATGVGGVDTGLRRDLAGEEDQDEEDEDEGDSDDDEMDGIGDVAGRVGMNGDAKDAAAAARLPMMTLEDVMRFTSTGIAATRRFGPATAGGVSIRG